MSDESNPGLPGLNDSPPEPPVLRPEIQTARADRGLLGMLMAICTLGGAGLGFGLATLRMDMRMMRMERMGWHGHHHCGERYAYDYGDSEMHTWLGVRIGAREDGQGVFVGMVSASSPAESVGLQRGDVIRSVNDGSLLHVPDDLVNFIRAREPGDLVTLEVVKSSGEVTHVSVRLSVHSGE